MEVRPGSHVQDMTIPCVNPEPEHHVSTLHGGKPSWMVGDAYVL